ncbi:MAG: AsmA-like C-terminal region-containing protein [Crocinitomicaceae bacterium]|nr:AsmA-like C-terminal region-containing protein [Crocinitomicaceae bacterium]
MKLIKKLLKWTGITLLVLIILLILIPVFFKDEIKEMVLDEVNSSLTAELTLEDFDLTFISTFPNMTIELMNARLSGTGEFEGVDLAAIENVKAHVGFWSIISGDQVEIDEIHITNPTINVVVLEDGLANYDIVKPDSLKTEEEISEPSSFKLSLSEYSITNGTIIYDDRASDMYAKIGNLNHTGTGDLTADIIDFETTTTMDELTYRMAGVPYLTEVGTDATVNLLMEFKENSSKFTLRENQISLNEITFSVDGFYEMLEDHDEMGLTLDASQATFKEFLSLIPSFYHSGYEGMISSGSLALNGFVKGRLDETNLPGWDLNLSIADGSVKYPDLPGKITNIQIDAGTIFPGGDDLNAMSVDVPKFHANFSKNTIDASLGLRNLERDPFIQSKILAHVDLVTLKDFVPLEEGESYNGILDADVEIKGSLSDLDRGDYEAFTARGTAELSEFQYASEAIPDDVDISRMMLTFSPENLTLNELDAKMGKSDFAMSGQVDNYFGYMLRDDTLSGDFSFRSNYLDLESMIPASETEGTITEEAVTPESGDPLLVPGNIDFNLATDIKKTRYNGIDIENVQGNVRLKDEIASLDHLTMQAMGGTVGVTGKYNTQDHQTPKMDFGYTLEDVDIKQLADNFLTIERLAPITKYVTGKISSNFDMNTELTASMEPILSSVASVGDIRSSSLTIAGFDNLKKLADVTKIEGLSSQTLNNFSTYFKVKDGKISVTPFTIKLGNIGTDVSGYTTLDQQMDYTLQMNIPKDELPKEIIKEVEGLLKQANAAIPFIDLGELPAIIPVKVKMIGDVKNPTITTDMREAIMNALGVEGNIVENITAAIQDTIEAVIDDQIDNAKEELEKQKKKIMADAQKEADKLKAECEQQAVNLWEEAYKQSDDAVKQAGSNFLKKKLAEEAAKIAKKEADKQLEKAKAECQKQADKIMATAQVEADKLGN